MRIKLILQPGSFKNTIPVNYNYFLTSLIYKTLESSSENFSRFLHYSGYRVGESHKGFKLFTYSKLFFRSFAILGQNIIFDNSPLEWFIASPVKMFIKHLVNGVFTKGQSFIIGRKRGEILFTVTSLELIKPPVFSYSMRFTCMSPMTLSKTVNSENKVICHYLRPWDEDISDAVKKNLLKKYLLIHGKECGSDEFSLELDKKFMVKKKEKVLKKIDFKGTDIIAFEAPFTAKGNPELIAVGYDAGFGEKGSMGFGMVKEVAR